MTVLGALSGPIPRDTHDRFVTAFDPTGLPGLPWFWAERPGGRWKAPKGPLVRLMSG